MFQHTATRRWLLNAISTFIYVFNSFNTQPPEGGCWQPEFSVLTQAVSTHSHPKVAAIKQLHLLPKQIVSTHSHPKVAAFRQRKYWIMLFCFNTQPPEGGCTQEGTSYFLLDVSTHSHPKVAASVSDSLVCEIFCFNTQPPEGGCSQKEKEEYEQFSFNTQPPEGGCLY